MAELQLKDIDHIFIDALAVESAVAQRAFKMFDKSKITVTENEPYVEQSGALSAKQFDRSKKEIFITNFKGQFFKRCPGARPGLTCCNYFVLNLGQQCNMNCSYCYLQSFINSPVMKIYANLEMALDELAVLGRELHDQPLRVGTGEVIDSLSLDELTNYSVRLIEFFKDYPKWRLEFKTKSSKVDHFINEKHAGNVIVSFSINPQNIIDHEEHGTASIEQRLAAAVRARDKGFLVSFHIDPMIYHPNWQNSYSELVDEVTRRFKPSDIPVMSVGALRFQPEQRHIMRERFGASSYVVQAEVFKGKDGKLRYDQAVRDEMFDFLLKKFREQSNEWKIFLCMESPETWLQTQKKMPKSIDGLETLFDHQLIKKFETHINSNG